MVYGSGVGTFTTDKTPAVPLLLGDLTGQEYLKPSIQGGSLAMGADMLSTVSDGELFYHARGCRLSKI